MRLFFKIQNEFITLFEHLFYFFGIGRLLYHPAPFGNDIFQVNKPGYSSFLGGFSLRPKINTKAIPIIYNSPIFLISLRLTDPAK